MPDVPPPPRSAPPPLPPGPPTDELQFDRVEPLAGAGAAGEDGGAGGAGVGGVSACLSCSRPITGEYWGVGEGVVCTPCHDGLLAGPQGSKAVRLGRAIAFGLGAGVAGALIWYAIIALTGYTLGLVALVVGFLVSSAVRAGARGKGGIGYQLTALVITYLAISMTYSALLIQEWWKQPDDDQTAMVAPGGAATQASAEGGAAEGATASQEGETEEILSGGRLIGALLRLFGFVLASPVLVGIHAPISGLVMCFALWQAWKLNRAVTIPFTGPFYLQAPGIRSTPAGGPIV